MSSSGSAALRQHRQVDNFRIPPAIRSAVGQSSGRNSSGSHSSSHGSASAARSTTASSAVQLSSSSSSSRRSKSGAPCSPNSNMSPSLSQSSVGSLSSQNEFQDLLQCMICFETYRIPKMLQVDSLYELFISSLNYLYVIRNRK